MPMDESQLKQFLADAGLLHARDFDAASQQAREQGRDLNDVLTGRYAVGEDDLRRAQARILGIPFVSLQGVQLSLDVMSIIPEAISRQENIVAYKKSDDTVEVAMLSGNAYAKVAFITEELGLRVLPRITDSASMKYALLNYQKFLERDTGKLIRDDIGAMNTDAGTQRDAATARLVDTLLRHASSQHASHIHIEPRDDSLAIRYRVDGKLYDVATLPLHTAEPIVRHLKKLSGMNPSAMMPQEGRFVARGMGEDLGVRASSLPLADGERMALRLMRDKRAGFSLESLGLSGNGLENVHDALHSAGGIIIVAAPTGNGLTTSLYTLLDLINAPHKNIGTVEDDIEYRIPRINHLQAQPAHGLSFAQGIRAHMRQDADVIMVSDLRDRDAAYQAIQAALHGRLVLAGIHAESTAEALDMIVSFGIDRAALSAAVRLVIAQRLVRKLSEERMKGEVNRDLRNAFDSRINAGAVLRALKDERAVHPNILWRDVPFYSAPDDQSYRGKTGIFEVMPMSGSIKDMLARGAAPQQLTNQARTEGMFTLTEHGIIRAAQGGTTLEEIARILG